MGLFTSHCPHCDAEIHWFLHAPEGHLCRCGESVSKEEIERDWEERYDRHLRSIGMHPEQREDWEQIYQDSLVTLQATMETLYVVGLEKLGHRADEIGLHITRRRNLALEALIQRQATPPEKQEETP